MIPKRRSTFWIATTHALSTSWTLPALIGLLTWAILWRLGLLGTLVAVVAQSITGLAMVGLSTLCSIRFVRSLATHERWTRCIVPAIVTYIIVNAFIFPFWLSRLAPRSAVAIAIFVCGEIGGTVVFAWITARGFVRLEAENAAADTTLAVSSDSTSTPARHWMIARLWGAGAGFLVASLVGFGLSIYMDHGWEPRSGWGMRITVTAIVGGIGAFLGLLFGPPRL